MDKPEHELHLVCSPFAKQVIAEELADTVVWRILDQLGIDAPNACRWQED